MITRVIRAILHNRCALRFFFVLWCALGPKSLGTTVLDIVIIKKYIFEAFYLLESGKSSPIKQRDVACLKIWKLCEFMARGRNI